MENQTDENFVLNEFTGDYQTDLRDPLSLKPHPDNPRETIDSSDIGIQSLAQDVLVRGIIEPLVITTEGYILCGHRRQAAAKIAGLTMVPVVIRELRSDEFAEDFFLSENGHRENLSVLEEARAIAALKNKLGSGGRRVTKNDLGRRLNMNSITVGDRLAILELPARVQQLFHQSELPLASSRQLLKLKDYPEEVEKFADRLVTHQVTGKSLGTLIDRRLNDLENHRAAPPRTKADAGARPYQALGERTPDVTRAEAVEILKKNSNRKISLFNINVLLDSICCHCGMLGNEKVCATCPLPKFVKGIAGRAELQEEKSW